VIARWGVVVALGVGLVSQVAAQRPGGQGGSRQPIQPTTHLSVPAHPFDVILCRPTSDSMTASVLWYEDAEAFIEYGPRPGAYDARTPVSRFRKGEAVEVVLSPLRPDTQYFYKLRSARTSSDEYTFHTARPVGRTFTFTVTADSHLDDRTDPATYQRTLANARADSPDFHVDLGDTFMTDKHASRENAARQYVAQRFFFGQLGRSVPLFLVLGNHDGETPRGPGRDPADLAVWSNTMRKRYFPNPVPDRFYTGDVTKHPAAGLLADYYAWQWGDALFVVLDPFWNTQQPRGARDNWSRTLGREQYDWLKRTLETSRATFKLVFIHNLVGGSDAQGRGGSEAARLFEWGGRNADGTDGFKQNRPGWPAPIHQLLVQNRVSIVFHGHDHFYAKQELDGVVYQEVPQPGNPGTDRVPRSATDYGYRDGVILGGSGHMRLEVSPAKLTAAYIRVSAGPGGQVAHTYSITPKPGTSER